MKPKRQPRVASAKNVLIVLLLVCVWLLTDGSASAGESMPRRGPVGAWDRGEHELAHIPTRPKEVPSITASGIPGLTLMAEEPAIQPGPSAPVTSPDTVGGAVRGWGNNDDGQVSAPAGLTGVTAVACGGGHSVALLGDGTLAAWGFFLIGQSRYRRATPPVGLRDVVAIAAGEAHALALKRDGTVIAWGSPFADRCNVPPGLSDVTAVSAGFGHSLALKSNGSVVAWGKNDEMQCSVPQGLSGVVAVAAGGHYSLALRQDGTIIAWGEMPAELPLGLNDVTAIAASDFHCLALRRDGTVVAWGSPNEKKAVTVPPGLNGVIAIAAGGSHSLALKRDGTVVAWGRDVDGECDVPPGLAGVTAIAAGMRHSLAVVGQPTSGAPGGNTGLPPAEPATGPRDLPWARTTLANAQRRLNAIIEEYKNRYSLHVIDRIDLAANRLTIHYSRYLVRKRGEEFDPNKKTRLFITDHWTYYVDLASIDSINLSPMVGRPDEECYLHIGAVADAITHDRTQYKKDGNVYYQGPSVRAYRGFNISLGFAEEGKALNVVLNDVLQAFRLVYPRRQ